MIKVSNRVPYWLFVSVVLAGQISCGKLPVNANTELTNQKSGDQQSAAGGSAHLQIADLAKLGDVKQVKISLKSADSPSGSHSYTQTEAYARDKSIAIANLRSQVYTLTVEVLDGGGKTLATGVAANIQIPAGAAISISIAPSNAGSSATLEVKLAPPVTDAVGDKKTDPVLTQEEKAHVLIEIKRRKDITSYELSRVLTGKAILAECGPPPQKPLVGNLPVYGCTHCGPQEPVEMMRYRESLKSWEGCANEKDPKVLLTNPFGSSPIVNFGDSLQYIVTHAAGMKDIERAIRAHENELHSLDRLMADLKNTNP